MTTSGINSSTVVKQIIPEYSSENSPLQPGDKVLKINNNKQFQKTTKKL